MKGIRTWRNPNNKFFVARLHYTADPMKATEEWKKEARRGVVSEAIWEREYEISFERSMGILVYEDFDKDIHLKSLQWNPELNMLRGWDFGYRHPACVFAQVDIDDRFIILRAILGEDILIHKFADKVLNISNKYFPDAKWRDYGDPAGRDASDKSEQSSIDILAGKRIAVITKRSGIREGLNTIRWHLKVREDGRPGLLLNNDPSTQILLDGFEGGYHLKEDKEGKTPEEEPDKDGYYDHPFDALRYIAINRLRQYSQMKVEEERKKTYVDRIYDKLMRVKKKRRVY